MSNIENHANPFSLGSGNVKAVLEDKARYVGSSGCSNGDSGAGVWNSSGELIGMNILVKHNTVKMSKSCGDQYTHAIGGVNVFINIATITVFALVSFFNPLNIVILFKFQDYIPYVPPIPIEE